MCALPDWCEGLPDAEGMRAIDRWAIETRGVPSLELMERAGLGVARELERAFPEGPVAALCGRGNNGGDGLVVARLLREAGRPTRVLCTAAGKHLSEDARANFERLPGEALMVLEEEDGGDAWRGHPALVGAGVILDALLGTGFAGSPRGGVARAIAAANDSPAPVVSVDVPSGVDASSGVVAGDAVRAALTVSFHAGKPGLWIHPGKGLAGEVRRIEIGIPRGAPAEARVGLISPRVLAELPHRGALSTKLSGGHVLVAGGSRDLSGAPRMAALACLRAGAGYVTAYLPESLQGTLAGGLLEVMTRGLPERHGELTPAGVQAVLDGLDAGRVVDAAVGADAPGVGSRRAGLGTGAGALVLGPGLGRGSGAASFARELAIRAPGALVLDADGLNAFAGDAGALAAREGPTVLTPHAGELARLLGCERAEIEGERLSRVRAAAEQTAAVVVLKGDDTLIAEPGGMVAVSPGGSPGLATAGTGDVLSGVIGALLAQGLDAFTAACAGVWLHVRAGREAARRQGSAEGVIASDVIAALPAARAPEPEPGE
ncbi:MAG TPA: NAD(P)H-hydrate dehydratase [Solirubrobacteraceae bacterium]|jgi:NAD(P)H-hydrate epimerase|nr:NAD(P)H-hydrate dehydratase [Solirubrobacteraceae bacterium]